MFVIKIFMHFLLALLSGGSLFALVFFASVSADAITVTEFPLPTAGSSPSGITAGPDGNLWFTESSGNKIGRITAAGVITEFPLPTAASRPWGITAGPDGNLWFTESSGNKIGRITTAGVITEFPLITAASRPWGITAGPDGNLWFADEGVQKIGRITTTGVVTEFPTLSFNRGITAGPDGNLWFVEVSGSKIGRSTTAGVITDFPLPHGLVPTGITAGPDGNLWFTETLSGGIGRSTTTGVITEFPLPYGGGGPVGITADPDGNVWFTEGYGNKIGRITTTGVITEFPLPTAGGGPSGITAGPDGNVWFTESSGNKIGRITLAAAPVALRGSVRNAVTNLPINGALIQISGPTNQITTTDSSGFYNFTALPAGSYNVTASRTDYLDGTAPGVMVVGGTTTVQDFSLTQLVILQGTVTDAVTHLPINVVTIQISGPSSQTTTTNSSGFYKFTALPAGSYNVTASQSGYLNGTASGVLVADGAMTVQDFDLTPLGTLQGTVTDAVTHLPINDTMIQISGPSSRATTTDSSGFYKFTALPAGAYNITASQPGYLNGAASGVLVVDGATTVQDFALTPGQLLTITEFPLPAGSRPLGITAGPDGNLWFTEYDGNSIGRITTTGIITEFPKPPGGGRPWDITAGPDGNLWFTEPYGDIIGKVTTTGVITEFLLPTTGSHPWGITAGPDGNLWFADEGVQKIGRITTAGVVTEFPTLSFNRGITAGPDNNLWFAEFSASKIGRSTTAGVIIEILLPTVSSYPQSITAGPDGNLWFTELHGNKIGRSTTAGVITEFPLPAASPWNITAGPDGNLWFTGLFGNKIRRITTAGVITEFLLPSAGSSPWGITAGPDGNVWFTESDGNRIGRITLAVAPVALQGTVRNAVTNLPINGATIQISSPSSQATTTDSSGSYNFTSLPAGSYNVTASRTDYLDGTASGVIVVGGATTVQDFTLTQLVTLQGTVTDAVTHLPINGATIQISGPSNQTTTTNSSGFYKFTVLPVGSYNVTASQSGYLNGTASGVLVADGSTTVQDFALTPLGTLQGTVTDAVTHLPINGATIQISGPGSRATTTNSSGFYNFTALPAGSYNVTASPHDYLNGAASGVLVVDAATTVQDFALIQLVTLQGIVTDAVTHLPINGATIQISSPGSRVTTTNSSGFYNFIALPAGSYNVTASRSGYLNGTPSGVVVDAATTVHDFVLKRSQLSAQIPAINEWGMLIISVLLGGSGIYQLGRKRVG